MKKRTLKKALLLITILLLINLPPVRWFTWFLLEDYIYSNYNGEFNCSEEYGNGSDFNGCKLVFAHYLKEHPQTKDTVLYRRFTDKPWRFWEWYQWLGHDRERFFMPYISKETIQENQKREPNLHPRFY